MSKNDMFNRKVSPDFYHFSTGVCTKLITKMYIKVYDKNWSMYTFS